MYWRTLGQAQASETGKRVRVNYLILVVSLIPKEFKTTPLVTNIACWDLELTCFGSTVNLYTLSKGYFW